MLKEKEIDDLLRAINDEKREDRERIIRILGSNWEKSEKIIPALVKSLKTVEDKKTRKNIISTLRSINREAIFPVDELLDILISDEDFDIKASIYNITIENISIDYLERLNKHLSNSNLDDESLGFIIQVVEKLGKKAVESADLLYSIYNSRSDVNIKTKAIEAIGSIACDKYYPILIGILKSERSKSLRRTIANSLKNLTKISDEVIDAILTLLINEKSDSVKQTFFSTLSKIGTNYKEKIIPALIQFIKNDDDDYTRKQAVINCFKMDRDSFPIKIVQELEQETSAIKKGNIYSVLDPLVRELKCRDKDELIKVYSTKGSSITSKLNNDPNNKLVFIIMAFKDDMEYTFEGIKSVAKKFKLNAKRVSDEPGDYKITEKIIEMIHKSKFIVADLTHERPNVYFELGYARGLGKTVFTIAKQGTKVHFDVKDWKCLFYIDSRDLEKQLEIEFENEMKKVK